MPPEVKAAFHANDANRDGVINQDEFVELWKTLKGARSRPTPRRSVANARRSLSPPRQRCTITKPTSRLSPSLSLALSRFLFSAVSATTTSSFHGDHMTWAAGADELSDDDHSVYEIGDDKYMLVGRGGTGVFFPFHQGVQGFELCVMIVLISTVYTTPMVRTKPSRRVASRVASRRASPRRASASPRSARPFTRARGGGPV